MTTERERFEEWLAQFRELAPLHGPVLWEAWQAALSVPEVPQWIPVSERLPESGVIVLACYTNRAGNVRRIRAQWVAAKTSEYMADGDFGEYDEATDTYYDPEGWYECIDNWGDYSSVMVGEGEITHWMPLPDAPKEPT
jgi:hypothetical protein